MECRLGQTQLDIVRIENSQCSKCNKEGKPFVGNGIKSGGTYILSDTYCEGRYEVLLNSLYSSRNKYVASPLRCKCKQIAKNLNNCKEWTLKELELIQPEKVICMGNVSTHMLKLKHFHTTDKIRLNYGSPWAISTYSLKHLSMRKDLLEEARKILEQF